MTDFLLSSPPVSWVAALPSGIHADRPAATNAGHFLCSTHSLLYRSNGSSWSTEAVIFPTGGSAGQALVKASDDDYTLEWSSAGGSSTVPYFVATSAAGDINLGVVSSFADITGLSLSVAAAAGDKILITAHATLYNENGADPDVGISVAGTIKSTNGYASIGVNKPVPIPVQWLHTVVSGDISGGNVAIKARARAVSGNTWVYNNATHGITATLSALNLGQ